MRDRCSRVIGARCTFHDGDTKVVGVIDDAKAGPMLYDRESDTLSATVRYRIKPNDGGKPVWMPPTSLPGKDTP